MSRLKLILLCCLLASTSLFAQNRIPNSPVSFSLPEGDWKYLQTTQVDRNTEVYLYSYKAHNVVDAAGDTVLPFMSIYVQRNYSGSLFDLVYSRYLKHPYQSLNESTQDLPGTEGIAYVGAYTSTEDGKVYEFRMLYFKYRNTVYEIRLETTEDTYDNFDADFQRILKSFKTER